MSTAEPDAESEQLDAAAAETILEAAERLAVVDGPLSGTPDTEAVEHYFDRMARALGGRFHWTGEVPTADLDELVAAADTKPTLSTAIEATDLTIEARLDHASVKLTEEQPSGRDVEPTVVAFNDSGRPELSIEGEPGDGYAAGSVSLDVHGCRRLAAQLLAVAEEVESDSAELPGYS